MDRDQPGRTNVPRERTTLRCLTSWIPPRPTVRCARAATSPEPTLVSRASALPRAKRDPGPSTRIAKRHTGSTCR